MPVIKSTLAEDFEKSGVENNEGMVSYEVKYLVRTTAGVLMNPGTVMAEAETIATGDQVPTRGSIYNILGSSDSSSICKRRTIKVRDPEEDQDLWEVVAFFEPLQNGESIEKFTQPHPKLWLPEVRTDWVERDEPVTVAKCLGIEIDYVDGSSEPQKTYNDLTGADIGPGTDSADLFIPIVNAAGQQPIDFLVDQKLFPMRKIKRWYPDEFSIDDLNNTYEGTANLGTFLGGSDKQWRYRITVAGEKKQKFVPTVGIVEYVEGITTFEGKRETHDKFILNNGMAAFRKDVSGAYITEDYTDVDAVDNAGASEDPLPEATRNKLFPILIPSADEGEGDQPTSEPLNLNSDGTYTPGISGRYVRWQNLETVSYAGFLLPFSGVTEHPWPDEV